MAFFSVFWGFFHASLSPDVYVGSSWPPLGIDALDPFAIPLLNTLLLLSSGAFITYSHHALINGNRSGAIIGAFVTIVLALLLQGYNIMNMLKLDLHLPILYMEPFFLLQRVCMESML